jgi:hypothetical protein
MAVKHPPELWRQSIRQNYDYRHGEASADAHSSKASAWEGALATTWQQSIHKKQRLSTRQSIRGWGQHALSSNICRGLSDIAGKASARATIVATPTTCMTSQSEAAIRHSTTIKQGLSDESKEILQRRLQEGGDDQGNALDAIVAGLRSF